MLLVFYYNSINEVKFLLILRVFKKFQMKAKMHRLTVNEILSLVHYKFLIR